MVRIAGMPGPTIGSAAPVGRGRTLAQVYRHFGEVAAAGASPLYERVAVALSESGEALRAIGTAPARKRHPTVILAALHCLALAGRAPALAAAYAAADGDAASGHSIIGLAVVRPVVSARRGHWPLLVAGPLPGVAGRALVVGQQRA
jgi:uncharacterized protein DUF2332